MLTRYSLIAIAALCTSASALAQDEPATSAVPPDMPATAAYPVRQDPRQVLGLNLIGAEVVSASGERIGRVSNLILDENGTLASVVIAVGGLFGIGTKNVAVTYPSLDIVRDKAGDAIDHVTVAATKDDLQHAAAFKSLHQQMAEVHGKR